MLQIENLSVSYGSFPAVRAVSLVVREGEFVALIGANGAGKTSTIKAASGLVRPAGGTIRFRGHDLAGAPSHRSCELGLIQVPEGRKLFAHLTVMDNLRLGAFLPGAAARERANLERVFGLFPRLAERRNQMAGTLSGGEQQMVALGRALMAEPRFLMLDEPTLGLSPKLSAEILEVLGQLNRTGLTVLVVCQEVLRILRLAHRGYVMENGTTVMEGKAQDLLRDSGIRRAYLGA